MHLDLGMFSWKHWGRSVWFLTAAPRHVDLYLPVEVSLHLQRMLTVNAADGVTDPRRVGAIELRSTSSLNGTEHAGVRGTCEKHNTQTHSLCCSSLTPELSTAFQCNLNITEILLLLLFLSSILFSAFFLFL